MGKSSLGRMSYHYQKISILSYYYRSLRVKTEEQWKKFATEIKSRYLVLRNNRSTQQSYNHLLSLIAALSTRWPQHKERIEKARKIFEYQFHSARPVEQSLAQLAQAVSLQYYTEVNLKWSFSSGRFTGFQTS